MPKKIENPMAEGIPSKIWFLCYATPGITTTRLAAEIYGEDKKHFSGRIIEWLKFLIKKGYVEDLGSRKGYKGLVNHLVEEIDKELSKVGKKLTPSEKNRLLKFLDGPLREIIDPQEAREYPSPLRYIYDLIGIGALEVTLYRELYKIVYGLHGKRLKKGTTIDDLNKAGFFDNVLPGAKPYIEGLGYQLCEKLKYLLPKTLRRVIAEITIIYACANEEYGKASMAVAGHCLKRKMDSILETYSLNFPLKIYKLREEMLNKIE
jgi:hypothetical protein